MLHPRKKTSFLMVIRLCCLCFIIIHETPPQKRQHHSQMLVQAFLLPTSSKHQQRHSTRQTTLYYKRQNDNDDLQQQQQDNSFSLARIIDQILLLTNTPVVFGVSLGVPLVLICWALLVSPLQAAVAALLFALVAWLGRKVLVPEMIYDDDEIPLAPLNGSQDLYQEQQQQESTDQDTPSKEQPSVNQIDFFALVTSILLAGLILPPPPPPSPGEYPDYGSTLRTMLPPRLVQAESWSLFGGGGSASTSATVIGLLVVAIGVTLLLNGIADVLLEERLTPDQRLFRWWDERFRRHAQQQQQPFSPNNNNSTIKQTRKDGNTNGAP